MYYLSRGFPAFKPFAENSGIGIHLLKEFTRTALVLALVWGSTTGIPILALEPPASKLQSFTLDEGLRVKVFHAPQMRHIHAQLLIHYHDDPGNPAIPYLTAMNIFDKKVTRYVTSLQGMLRKMGNDFEVENRSDFLRFKINFLPDKMPQFIKFLKALYNYRPLTSSTPDLTTYSDRRRVRTIEQNFKDSVDYYWKHFFQQKDWEKQIATQLAYQHFFPKSVLGRTFINPTWLKNVTLAQLRKFYRKTYVLPNSLLVLKGNIPRPVMVYGRIRVEFGSFKKAKPIPIPEENISINNNKKLIIFNVEGETYPTIYWFEAISTFNQKNPLTSLILNNILFAYPTGRLFLDAGKRNININSLKLETEMINHRTVSVICNTIRLRIKDMERFLQMADREKKKLKATPVERKEFLNILSSIFGRIRVNTRDVENDVNIEIMKIKYQTPKVTLAGIDQTSDSSDNTVIVMVGSARVILDALPLLRDKVEVINYNLSK